MTYVLEPQLRRTSEVRYHSDLAPGRRFVFVGRVIDPVCRLYIVGRQLDEVPADQPEWLDDHRHNCPTFYVLIGRNPDLTGLAAEIVIAGRPFLAESPAAILLPPAVLHHHRLTKGGGWSFHVNVRPDYEESLLDAPVEDLGGTVDLDRVYRRAEPNSQAARDWVICSAATGPYHNSLPLLWKFIDPGEFEAPGVRLHAEWLSGDTRGRWSEAVHCHPSDEVTILLSYGPEPLAVETTGAGQAVTARSPISVYVPRGVPHRYRHVSGEGLALKFLKLPSERA